ncbi:hypothetical protein [Pelotomaculum terephthalicicum]|uniref:hypothetical protein n=1 Tax=Pelotomaculum terephthalicicum TaxID=206393 RepID=UPI0035E3CDC8
MGGKADKLALSRLEDPYSQPRATTLIAATLCSGIIGKWAFPSPVQRRHRENIMWTTV